MTAVKTNTIKKTGTNPDKITKRHDEVDEILKEGKEYCTHRDAEGNALPETTPGNNLEYAIKRVTDSIVSAIKASKCEKNYAAKLNDLRVEKASVDKEGNLLRDNAGRLKYSKQEQKELTVLMQEEDDKLDAVPIEFEPYIVPMAKVPRGLTYKQVELFRGIVIPEDYELKFADEPKK